MIDNPFDQWLAKRRRLAPPVDLTDQIMSRIMELESHRQSVWWLRLFQRIEESRVGRWGVCGAALAVGSLPFVFLAYVAGFVNL